MTAQQKNANVPEGMLVDSLEWFGRFVARRSPALGHHLRVSRLRRAAMSATVLTLVLAVSNPLTRSLAAGWVVFWVTLTWYWVANPREAARRRRLRVMHTFRQVCVKKDIRPKDRPGQVDLPAYPQFVLTKWYQRDRSRPWRRAPGPQITMDGPNVYGTVRTPDGMTADELQKQVGDIASAWPKDRKWGYPEMVRMTQAAQNRARELDIAIIVRPLYAPPAYALVPPAGLHTLEIGQGLTGIEEWDRRDDAHAYVAGPTRAGKGDLVRRWATSALLGGWHVVVFDRTGSAEWPIVAAHPNCTYMYCDPSDPESWFSWASETFTGVTDKIGGRNQWLNKHGFDTWAHYADDTPKATVLRDMPPLLVVFDELTTTLGAGAGSDELKKLQKMVGGQTDAATRSWAKAGGGLVLVDQITHQGDTTLGSGSRAQLGRWVAVGALDEEHRPMVSGIRNWPWIPEAAKGHGCTGRRGQTAHEVRWGECPRAAIAASLSQVRP